jgi:hypothetical protein
MMVQGKELGVEHFGFKSQVHNYKLDILGKLLCHSESQFPPLHSEDIIIDLKDLSWSSAWHRVTSEPCIW